MMAVVWPTREVDWIAFGGAHYYQSALAGLVSFLLRDPLVNEQI
jgi:hypothetical protein